MIEKQPERPITIRFPADVAETIKQYAATDKRSYNAEVVWILLRYIAEREREQQSAASGDNEEQDGTTHTRLR